MFHHFLLFCLFLLSVLCTRCLVSLHTPCNEEVAVWFPEHCMHHPLSVTSNFPLCFFLHFQYWQGANDLKTVSLSTLASSSMNSLGFILKTWLTSVAYFPLICLSRSVENCMASESELQVGWMCFIIAALCSRFPELLVSDSRLPLSLPLWPGLLLGGLARCASMSRSVCFCEQNLT